MAISSVSSYTNTYDNLYAYKQTNKQMKTSKTDNTAKTKTGETDNTSKTKTETAKKSTGEYLSELSKKYTGLNIVGGNASYYKRPKNNCVSSDYYHDVTISPVVLKKMMSDPEEAAKYEKMLAGIQKYEGWANSMVHAMCGGAVVYSRRTFINENGGFRCTTVGPSEQQIKADEKRKEDEQETFEKRLEKAREKSKEHRKQMEEWLKGDKEEVLPGTDTSMDIDTSDSIKIVSIDIKL